MIRSSCLTVRRQIAAFLDGELTIDEQVRVESHLRACPACASDAAECRAVGAALRDGAPATAWPPDALDGLAESIVSRMKAEQDESLSGRTRRMFEDLHLVWAVVGATGSAVACVALMVGIFYLAAMHERPDSLAALLAAMASPGSNENPMSVDGRMALPRPNPDDLYPVILSGEDATFTFAVVLTRDGRISTVELVQGDRAGGLGSRGTSQRDIVDLLDSVSNARFEPARSGGGPVAVNMVWMMEHLTVRPKIPGESRLLSPAAAVQWLA